MVFVTCCDVILNCSQKKSIVEIIRQHPHCFFYINYALCCVCFTFASSFYFVMTTTTNCATQLWKEVVCGCFGCRGKVLLVTLQLSLFIAWIFMQSDSSLIIAVLGLNVQVLL